MRLDGHAEGPRVSSNWEVPLPDLAYQRYLSKGNNFVVLVVDVSPSVGLMLSALEYVAQLGWQIPQGQSDTHLTRMIPRPFLSLNALADGSLLIGEPSLGYLFEKGELVVLEEAVVDDRVYFLL